MDIGSLLVADAQSAKLVEPGKAPAPRPIAVGPARCRAQCYASRARVRCRAHADLSGLPQRRNHGRLPRNQDDSADAPEHSLQLWDGINKRERLLRIVTMAP